MTQRGRGVSKIPATQVAVRAWLKGSTEGRDLLHRMTQRLVEEAVEEKCRVCQQAHPYPRVLVVLRRLGNHPGVEVYSGPGVLVHIEELPDAPGTAACDLLLEQVLEIRLPKTWRWLLETRARRIHSGVFRAVSLDEWLYYLERAEVFRGLLDFNSEAER